MRYLFDTGKYNLVELANGIHWDAPPINTVPVDMPRLFAASTGARGFIRGRKKRSGGMVTSL